MTTSQRDSDVVLLDFVREKIDSFVKWDLVRFFHDNPYAANTAENIARVAARDPRTVEPALDELVSSGILVANTVGAAQIYRFAKDQEIRDTIRSFFLACDDPDFRVRAINQVIEGLQ